MKSICYIVQVKKKIIMLKYDFFFYWNEEKTDNPDNVKMKTKRWKYVRNYSIIICDENAMEIGNKDWHNTMPGKRYATKTQRYKCLLHAKFGNQPYPDEINVYYMLSLVIRSL